ncbi:cupin domain-containing protein [filamentous cyanobacterium CCP5]|nr:cupin domain-containing protein [filamentous cyanobacterium CCP5]
MTTQTLRTPKVLAAGEGDSFQMLSHTFTYKVTPEDTRGQWLMYEAADTFGNGAPLHSHPWEETFYILEGELQIQIGKRTCTVKAGDTVYFPEDVTHGFTICSETVRILVIMPAYADGFYREVSDKITSLPPHPEVFQAVAENHNLKLFI